MCVCVYIYMFLFGIQLRGDQTEFPAGHGEPNRKKARNYRKEKNNQHKDSFLRP